LALGLGPDDILWTVPNTFVASANCARYCGADVDFVDIDPLTWNMSVDAVENKLLKAERDGRLPKIVIPVHFAGQPTEQQRIGALAKRFGFRVIEDASHAIGAAYRGERVGSCRWSDITIFSLHPVKIITSAEGGVATTNDEGLADRMRLFRSHGIVRDPARFTAIEPIEYQAGEVPAWYYEQQQLGFNYRLTDIQAALGSSQLARLDAYVDRRNELAHRYDYLLKGLRLQIPTVLQDARSAFHLYVVRVLPVDLGKRRSVFDDLRRSGIGVNVHYIPVHLQPYYRSRGFSRGQFPEAEYHGASALSLPLYPGLSDQQQEEVVIALRSAVSRHIG
jgi:UDP-4-amino-4,6-dideoxy-N-acetyl-beta-L-altrosamine transaminase